MHHQFWNLLTNSIFGPSKQESLSRPEVVTPEVVSSIQVPVVVLARCDTEALVAGTHVGLIQTSGIGDLIIALPIAAYLQKRGCVVHWPVESGFAPFMREATTGIDFIEIDRRDPKWLYATPLRLLEELQCDPILPLYSHLPSIHCYDDQLAAALKFDEYKYAFAGVPFSEKWNLNIRRNLSREMALFNSLNIDREYICVHRHESTFSAYADWPDDWLKQYQIVEIDEIPDNPFDWIYTLEQASKLVLMDSCMANLVEQLKIGKEKYLILSSDHRFTPVFKSGWKFI